MAPASSCDPLKLVSTPPPRLAVYPLWNHTCLKYYVLCQCPHPLSFCNAFNSDVCPCSKSHWNVLRQHHQVLAGLAARRNPNAFPRHSGAFARGLFHFHRKSPSDAANVSCKRGHAEDNESGYHVVCCCFRSCRGC